MPSDINLMEKGVNDMKKKYLGDKKKRMKRNKDGDDLELQVCHSKRFKIPLFSDCTTQLNTGTVFANAIKKLS